MTAPRLIGRWKEFELSAVALSDAALSKARSILFEGPPGIGKSTLLDAFATDAADRGFVVLRAMCDEPGVHRPFGVFVDLLGLGRPGVDPRFDQLERLVLEATPPTEGDPTQSPDLRVRIADEIGGLVESLTLDGPVAVVVDDLQWSDPSSLLALGQVLTSTADRRLAFFGAHRPGPSPELARLPAERLVLDGLDDADVRLLVADLSDAPPDDSLLEVVGRAGGNPLFVTELVGALLQEDRIEIVDGMARTAGSDLPQSVHATVRRRMAGMPRDTISMLTVAAVLGEPFALEDVAVVTRTDGVDVYSRLEPAVEGDFLHEVGSRFDFRHDVVREALYLDLPVPARRAFHLKIARALAAVGAPAQRVARHFALGAETGDSEAAEWLRRAGAELTPYAPATALELLEQALALVGRAAPDRLPILRDVVTAAFQAGAFEACERAARELLGGTGDLTTRMTAHNARYGVMILQERYPEALAEVEAVLAVDGMAHADRAMWTSLLASTCMGMGEIPRALEAADDAMRQGRETGVSYATGRALTVQAAGRKLMGAYAEAADLARQSLEEYVPSATVSFRNQSPSYDLYQAYVFNSPMLIDADRFEETEEMLRVATIGFADLGQVPMLVLAHRALAVVLFHAGRWDEASTELATVSAVSESQPGGRALFGDVVPEMLARMDELDRAADALHEARGAFDTSMPHPGSYWIASGEAYLLAANGDRAGAIDRLAKLHDIALALGITPDIRAVSVPLMRLLVGAGQRDTAEKVLVDVEAAAARAPDVPSVAGTALLARGLVHDDMASFDAAIESLRRSPRRAALAAALEDGGTRGSGEQRVRVERLEEARSLFESFGAVRDVRRVSATLRSLGVRSGARGARGRPVSGWHSLTPSEVRVVELLSEGLTNPQIGERLYLSRKTVATHVSAALRKLGVSSRTEIAAIVARRGDG